MCGIFALIFKEKFDIEKKSKYEKAFNKISHRGPDFSVLTMVNPYVMLGFHRLSINDVSASGNQPFFQDERCTVVNGEIYNHNELKKMYNIETESGSDCEVIGALLNKHLRMDVFPQLDGVFAGVSVKNNSVIAFRDPIGIRPLFYTETEDFIGFSSEAKALTPISNSRVKIFPIGSYWYEGQFIEYAISNNIHNGSLNYSAIKHLFIQAVEKRIKNCERGLGFFLSGGLDSSLVASVAKSLMPEQELKTFSIGMYRDAPDLRFAKHVAHVINSEHHEVIFTPEEGIKCIKDVIYHCETYDCTTIRASVPMYLLSKYIRENTDVKVMLSGEGADELFGGYLYFHNAISEMEFIDETERLVNDVHKFDALRADRATSAWGLEVRVPFFDKFFNNYVRQLPGRMRMPSSTGIEKDILRSAFSDFKYIPKNVLWRQKDAFSDAVGYNWVNVLKDLADKYVMNEEFSLRNKIFPVDTPQTKEDFLYRKIYTEIFGDTQLGSSGKWLPKWVDNITDPSATYLKIHSSSKA